MRRAKVIIILSCLMLNVILIPVSFSNDYKERVISCYNNGLERQIKISQKEYEYINEKLEEIRKYGMSSERGVYETEKLVQYLKENEIIDLTPFLRYLKLSKEKKEYLQQITDGENLPPFNLFCFVVAWMWTDHAPRVPTFYLNFRDTILLKFLDIMIENLEGKEGKINEILLSFVRRMALYLVVKMVFPVGAFIFSNGVVEATFIDTCGLLGEIEMMWSALLFGFTGIKIKVLFGFCILAVFSEVEL